MEAATQALAILSTDFAGVPEFLTDGREGLLAPPASPDALGERLARLIRDPALRSALGKAAYRRVCDDFSFDAGIAAVLGRLRRVAGLAPPPAGSQGLSAAAE